MYLLFVFNYDYRKLFVGGLSWETQQGIIESLIFLMICISLYAHQITHI